MIREIRYVNSLGAEVTFGGEAEHWGFGETDLLDFGMEYNEVGGRITSFTSGIAQKSLQVYLWDGTEEERKAFVDVLCVDARRGKPGTIYAGDSYLTCYASGLAMAEWYYFEGMLTATITITAERPVWVRDHRQTLKAYAAPEGGLDYPHDYAYDYTYSSGTTAVVSNPSPLPSPVDIAFPGPCTNPFVIIAGNRYQVMASAAKGELILVRGYGRKKDIILRSASGDEQSIFSAGIRKANAHVFSEVPSGDSVASWDGVNSIELTVYEELITPW